MEHFQSIVIGFINGTVSAEQAHEALADLVIRDSALWQPCIQMLNQMLAQRQLTPKNWLILHEALINPLKYGTGAGDREPVKIGSVIKVRYVLEELIGKGGMGMVYKARDMHKEEAQDRFPYVALKVFNEEFKQHPESLKVLQKELCKAQQLAHPNIVNVYDFDRDSGNVYMTMEFLQGEPLDIHIRKNRFGGMSWSKTLPLIKGMCLALDYAHGHHIIHSDFKPGSCFVTKDGSVKVFDFGLARAAKFGLLTPAYATCEMFDGKEPDRLDDVYALACTIYELLAGKHPFQKRSAAEALRKGWTPAPIKGLSRSRNKALARGLALTREKRTKSALTLLQELNPRKTSMQVKVAAGSVAVLLLAFVAGLLD